MPIYKYKCLNIECGKEHESIEPLNTKFITCPFCSKISKRIFTSESAVFRLHGSCWSRDNYIRPSNIHPDYKGD